MRTGGHSVKVAKNRLFETFQLMLQITRSLDAVKPGGEGFASAVRVRFLHASVRNRILKLNDQRPGYFDVEQFGVPMLVPFFSRHSSPIFALSDIPKFVTLRSLAGD